MATKEKKFFCDLCDHQSRKNYDYNVHLNSVGHMKNYNLQQIDDVGNNYLSNSQYAEFINEQYQQIEENRKILQESYELLREKDKIILEEKDKRLEEKDKIIEEYRKRSEEYRKRSEEDRKRIQTLEKQLASYRGMLNNLP